MNLACRATIAVALLGAGCAAPREGTDAGARDAATEARDAATEPSDAPTENATEGGEDATFCVEPWDAGPCDASIHASNYDQTCGDDSDCILVGVGDFCTPCGPACTLNAINRASLSQYETDVDNTPAGTLPVSCAPCCGPVLVACCDNGHCTAAAHCAAQGRLR